MNKCNYYNNNGLPCEAKVQYKILNYWYCHSHAMKAVMTILNDNKKKTYWTKLWEAICGKT